MSASVRANLQKNHNEAIMPCSGRLTQWFRVPSSHGGSHWFESSTAHHLILKPGTQAKSPLQEIPSKRGVFFSRAGSAPQYLHQYRQIRQNSRCDRWCPGAGFYRCPAPGVRPGSGAWNRATRTLTAQPLLQTGVGCVWAVAVQGSGVKAEQEK